MELCSKPKKVNRGNYLFTGTKKNIHSFLFKGIIKCAECDCTISWETQKGNIYGHCHHYRPCNQNMRLKEEQIELQLIDVLDRLKIKNSRIADWMKKSLKESHQDEKHYRQTSLEELNKQYDKLQVRLDKMYEDKLDEKIKEDFYNRKEKEYRTEQSQILEDKEKHQNSDINYKELGLNFYELAQRGKEIYLKLREKPEEKRKLLKLVFENFKLNNGILNYTYTKPFEILEKIAQSDKSSKVPEIQQFPNVTFELLENSENYNKRSTFMPLCTSMRYLLVEILTFFEQNPD